MGRYRFASGDLRPTLIATVLTSLSNFSIFFFPLSYFNKQTTVFNVVVVRWLVSFVSRHSDASRRSGNSEWSVFVTIKMRQTVYEEKKNNNILKKDYNKRVSRWRCRSCGVVDRAGDGVAELHVIIGVRVPSQRGRGGKEWEKKGTRADERPSRTMDCIRNIRIMGTEL